LQLKIEIDTKDFRLLNDLFETKKRPEEGATKQIAEGVIIKYEKSETKIIEEERPSDKLAFYIPPETLHLAIIATLNIGCSILASLISRWIYEKIKGRNVEKIKIENVEIKIDRDAIKKTLEEVIADYLKKEKQKR